MTSRGRLSPSAIAYPLSVRQLTKRMYGHTVCCMAIPKIKATYSLDEPTVRRLEEIARKWETSKSDALSRLINQGASDEEDAEVKRKLDALDRYQKSMSHLTREQIDEWQRDSSEIRHSWANPWDKA